MLKFCYVNKCKYPYDHLTGYHKCGKCGSFGHGFTECSKNNNGSAYKENKLHELSCEKTLNPLPKNLHCEISSCKLKHTHTTNSHHDLFSRDKYGTLIGPDQHGITATYNKIKESGPSIVKNYNNSYTKLYWGMGITYVFRNINGRIDSFEIESFDDYKFKEMVKNLQYIPSPDDRKHKDIFTHINYFL
jgi:hypothetical protein